MPFTALLARVKRTRATRRQHQLHQHGSNSINNNNNSCNFQESHDVTSIDDPIFLPMFEPSPRRSSLSRFNHHHQNIKHQHHQQQNILTQSLHVHRDDGEPLPVDPFSSASSSSSDRNSPSPTTSSATTTTHAHNNNQQPQQQQQPRSYSNYSYSHSNHNTHRMKSNTQQSSLISPSAHTNNFKNATLFQQPRSNNNTNNQPFLPLSVNAQQRLIMPDSEHPEALKRQLSRLLSERSETIRALTLSPQPLSSSTSSSSHPNSIIMSSLAQQSNKPLQVLVRDVLHSLREERTDLKRRLFNANANTRRLSARVSALQRAHSSTSVLTSLHHHHHHNFQHRRDNANNLSIGHSSLIRKKTVNFVTPNQQDHRASHTERDDTMSLQDNDELDDDEDLKDSRKVVSEPSSLNGSQRHGRNTVHVLLRALRDERHSATVEKNRLLRDLYISKGETTRLKKLLSVTKESSTSSSSSFVNPPQQIRKPSSSSSSSPSQSPSNNNTNNKKTEQEDEEEKQLLRQSIELKIREQVRSQHEEMEKEIVTLRSQCTQLTHMKQVYEEALKDTRDEMQRLRGSAGDLQRRVLTWRSQTRNNEMANAALVQQLKVRGEELARRVEKLRDESEGEYQNERDDDNDDVVVDDDHNDNDVVRFVDDDDDEDDDDVENLVVSFGDLKFQGQSNDGTQQDHDSLSFHVRTNKDEDDVDDVIVDDDYDEEDEYDVGNADLGYGNNTRDADVHENNKNENNVEDGTDDAFIALTTSTEEQSIFKSFDI